MKKMVLKSIVSKTIALKPFAVLALCAAVPVAAVAQPLEDWIAVAQSQTQTLLMKRTAAEIYPDGTRRASVKTAYNTPQSVGGVEFTTTVARMVFDCKSHHAKIVHTDFIAPSGEIVYADDTPDATFMTIKPDSGPALIEDIVCQTKKAG